MSVAEAPLAMIDAASPSAEVDNIPSLDAVTFPVESETPAVETDLAAKVDDKAKPAEKPAADATATTPISNAKVVDVLKTMKSTDPAMAKHLYNEVKYSQDAKRLMHELAPEAKTIEEAKAIIASRVDNPETKAQLDAVAETDRMLYEGGEAHRTLVDNILADLTSELGDKEGPARLSELSESVLEKLKTADPDGHTRITRCAFLAASETSGLITSLNTLNEYIAAGDTKSASALLKSIGAFFSKEISENQSIAKTRTESKAAAEKATTATVQKLRDESEVSVNKTMTTTLGGFLSPFLKDQLKGVSRADLGTLASTIMSETKLTLGKDAAYVKEVTKLYREMKTPAQKDKLTQMFEATLKKNDFGKKLVERVCREKYPDRFTVKPVAAKPTTVSINVNGKAEQAYVLSKRPENLIRDSVTFKGREYHAGDLQQLQMMSRGFIKSKTGNTILCTWKAKV